MAGFHSVVVLALGDPFSHDPEGKLLELGKKATGVAMAAHLLPDESEEKETLFQKAIDPDLRRPGCAGGGASV
jgi:hypothetical protein